MRIFSISGAVFIDADIVNLLIFKYKQCFLAERGTRRRAHSTPFEVQMSNAGGKRRGKDLFSLPVLWYKARLFQGPLN
jgi:hypothetical protein